MGLSVDASQNYRVWGNTESVLYTSHGRDRDHVFALPTVKRRVLTYKELAASAGVYTSRNRIWLLPATVVNAATRGTLTPSYFREDAAGSVNRVQRNAMTTGTGFTPKPADWITDGDGIRWTVLEPDFQALKSTWKLTTLSLVLAFDLRDTVAYWPVTDTQDATGARVATFPAASVTNIPARIQPVGGDISDERGQRLTKQQFTVYLGQQIEVRAGSQLRDQNGLIYEVQSDQNAGRMDVLQEVNVEIRAW